MPNRVVHFEIHASTPQELIEFYNNVFGWEFKKMGEDEYWMVMTSSEGSEEAGINGGLMLRKSPRAENGQGINAYVCTIQVENLNEILEKVGGTGGRQVVDTVEMDGVGQVAYCQDPDGNIFGVIQPPQSV